MNYNFIIFDLDGTISNSKEGITNCLIYALEHFGIKEEADNLEHFIGPPLLEQLMMTYDFSEDEAQRAVELYRERYVPIGVYETSIYPGVKELIISLKNHGKTVALGTSKPQHMAENVLKHFEIYDYFDYIQGADMNGPIHDKTDVLKALLDQAGITESEKKQVVMIGDTSYDVVGAVDVGIDCIGVNYGFGDKEQMLKAGAKHIVETAKELQEIIINK